MFNFDFLKKSVAELGTGIRKVRSEIEKLQREREDLIAAPTAKEDIKAAIEKWMSSKSDQYSRAVQRTFQPFIGAPKKIENPNTVQNMFTLLGVQGDGLPTPANSKTYDAAICGLFGPMILKTIFEMVDTWDWSNAGLPKAQRDAKVAQLDEKISKLIEEESKLTTSAHQAGIIID